MLGRANAGREWPCGGIEWDSRTSPLQGIRRRWRFSLGGATRDVWERESVGAIASGSAGQCNHVTARSSG